MIQLQTYEDTNPRHGCRQFVAEKITKRMGSTLDYAAESLKLHYQWKGKIEVTPRAAVDSKDALSLALSGDPEGPEQEL